jgi:hypothetical protein
MSAVLTVVLWNVQWRKPGSSAGETIRRLIAAHDPDLICLTESHLDLVDAPHRISSDPDFGLPMSPTRRKVVLWSRQPWSAVDDRGDAALPSGRFVCGQTATPLGVLTVLGVCIPWSGAQVATGRQDRAPWQEHGLYLDGLGQVLARRPPLTDTILLGDVNQTVPRTRAPQAQHDALLGLLAPHLDLATQGAIPGLAYPTIDHLAHSRDLAAVSVAPLANRDADGARLSDHVGLVITLRRARTA